MKLVEKSMSKNILGKLNESAEKLNIFDLIDEEYVLSDISDSREVYLSGNIDDIINSFKSNGCEISNYTNQGDFEYCDILYHNYNLNLDSYSNYKYNEANYVLTGVHFYYDKVDKANKYFKYNVNFTIEGDIEDEERLKKDILSRLKNNSLYNEHSKIEINDFNLTKIEE